MGSRSRTCDPPRYGGKDCEGAEEETGQPCNENKHCQSGTLAYASIDGNELDDIDEEGTSFKVFPHTLTTCAQVFLRNLTISSNLSGLYRPPKVQTFQIHWFIRLHWVCIFYQSIIISYTYVVEFVQWYVLSLTPGTQTFVGTELAGNTSTTHPGRLAPSSATVVALCASALILENMLRKIYKIDKYTSFTVVENTFVY